LLDLAVEKDVVKRSGTWYSYGDERLGQGRDRVIELLTENPDLLKKMETELRTQLGFVKSNVESTVSADPKSKSKSSEKKK
jgi:recombination protein RecA